MVFCNRFQKGVYGVWQGRDQRKSSNIYTLFRWEKSSFYYSLNNTPRQLYNGKPEANNLFDQSYLSRFYNPEKSIVASFALEEEAIIDLEQNYFNGKVILLIINHPKTGQILIKT